MPNLARKSHTHPMGPLDELLKAPVPEQMKADFNVMASICDKSSAELLRDIISEYLYGSYENALSHARHSMGRPRIGHEEDQ